MNSHTIVYLDQNYLSNMAKALAGLITDEDQAKFWHSLFDDLKKAVLANKVASPEAEFHLTEAKYDKRLEEPIVEIIDALSWGLQFRPWRSILESQVEDAAREFLGKQPEERKSWAIAFQSDPHGSYKNRMQDIWRHKVRINVHPSLTNEDIDHDRQLKLGFLGQAEKLLKEYSNNPLGWSELLVQSKKSVIDGFMGKLAEQSIIKKLQVDSPWEDKLIALENFTRLEDLWNRIHKIGINPKDSNMVMSFAESEELLNSPFIDINASIWAAIAECYLQGRKIQTGDFYDVPILAAALPYCDIIATKSFMKEILVNMLHFDEKYKARIFSATKADRLAFQKLVRTLI